MRTTLTLDEDVADYRREQASLQSRPFKQVVNKTLRQGMSPAVREEKRVYRVKPHRSGFRPGVDPLKLHQLNDVLESQDSIARDAG